MSYNWQDWWGACSQERTFFFSVAFFPGRRWIYALEPFKFNFSLNKSKMLLKNLRLKVVPCQTILKHGQNPKKCFVVNIQILMWLHDVLNKENFMMLRFWNNLTWYSLYTRVKHTNSRATRVFIKSQPCEANTNIGTKNLVMDVTKKSPS